MEEKEILFEEIEVGKELPPFTYIMKKDTILKYAEAVEDFNPLFIDEGFAKKSNFKGLIAHPTTAALYSLNSFKKEKRLPPGIIHAKQVFEFYEPVRPDDLLTTETVILEKYIRKERKYVTIKTVTKNQDGKIVVVGLIAGIWPK